MRGYSVNPRVSPVCGGSVLTIDGIDTNLVREQEITILGQIYEFDPDLTQT